MAEEMHSEAKPVPAYRLESVSVVYPGARGASGGRAALRELDLQIEPGECLVIVGESGSGKTSLLKCLNRLIEPHSGRVYRGGEDIAGLVVEELRRAIGYVQQEGGLMPHWTILRNIGLVPRLLGWAPDRIEARSRELINRVGLGGEDLEQRLPSALSGGQRQRVAFARALAADPDTLLLDEPFGALDPITRRRLQDQFQSWQRELHKTTVLVTHDMAEALRLGDRVAVLRDGRFEQLASPEQLREHPATDYVTELMASVGV
jgi:osmoprotectant transport system ATP-binding protein